MSEHIEHWAESLQPADRVKATIRYDKNSGRFNRHNVDIIVVSVSSSNQSITGYDKVDGYVDIPFNELKKPESV